MLHSRGRARARAGPGLENFDRNVTLQKQAGDLDHTFFALVQHSADGVVTFPDMKVAHDPSSAYAVVPVHGSCTGDGSRAILSLQL